MSKKLNKIFFYGVFMVGSLHGNCIYYPKYPHLKTHLINVIGAKTTGKVDRTGNYPRADLSERGNIYGELHVYSPEKMPEILKIVDEIMGEGDIYKRKVIGVMTEQGEVEEAYCYDYIFTKEEREELGW